MICPFNWPLILTIRTLSMSLLCGNAHVWKPSPNCPLYGNILQECVVEAGIPSGISQMIHGVVDVANAIIQHPMVGHVTFVGSTEIGAKVGAACAEQMKPSTLELGGKSP